MSYIQIQKGGKRGKKRTKYVHLAWNEWDPHKQRSVQRRFYVGRIDADGKVVVTRSSLRGDVRVTEEEVRTHASERASFEAWLREVAAGPTLSGGVARVDVVGDSWAVQHLAAECGLLAVLLEVFGSVDGGALAGLAAHQLVTGHALYRAGDWLGEREAPDSWKSALVGEAAVHGFVARIGEQTAQRENFLERWAGSHKSTGALLHDITSVSSYSSALELAEWGHNRDNEALPQINFSLAAAPDGVPLFYRVIPEAFRMFAPFRQACASPATMESRAPILSLDRGFYSQANLRELLALNCGFLIGVPWSVKQAVTLFRKHAVRLTSARHGFLFRGVPLRHVVDNWTLDDVPLTLHLFFDPARHTEAALRFEKTVRAFAAKAQRETFRTAKEATAWIRENTGSHASCLGSLKPPTPPRKSSQNPTKSRPLQQEPAIPLC